MIKILITALGFILLSAVTISQMEIVSAAPGGNSNKPTSPKVKPTSPSNKPTSPRHLSNSSTEVTFTGTSRFISLVQ